MRSRMIIVLSVVLLLTISLASCKDSNPTVKIGVSMGVGAASRWDLEKTYMENHAKELGAEIEVRVNRTDTPLTQQQDCIQMIDDGIDVLILVPRNTSNVDGILDYAKQKKVPVISYARMVTDRPVDLYVGYDSERIGQRMGQHITEVAFKGNYIILQGDLNDDNAVRINEGAMRYISPIMSQINVILNAPVPGWSADEAKKMVIDAVSANNNQIDAILAPNDKIAGACAEALAELGITKEVVITGADAELDAVKRIVAGTQDITIYMDLNQLSKIAISEAYNLAKGQHVETNAELDNGGKTPIAANLITGQLITRENLDRVLIDGGVFTREEVYGK